MTIMMWNINQPFLCNGIRFVAKKLMNNIHEVIFLKGMYEDDGFLISRVPLIPNDMPFDFKKLRFPMWHLQTADSVCEINLENSCFLHGQLYDASSLLEYQ